MKVENVIMYHISPKLHWNVGDVIVAGEVNNPFWEICKNYSLMVRVDGQEMSIIDITKNAPNFSVSQQNIDFLYSNLKTITKEFSFFVRETAFEDYRKNNHPDLPSRQKCLWVAEQDALAYWETMKPNTQRSLLTLELNGILFCADEYWLRTDTLSSVEFSDKARHYWAGEMGPSPIKEYLFCGTATVKDVQLIT